MNADPDPRIYFAAERTLLAWLRTGIAVIGLGFLVARFGVFLMLIRGQMIQGNQSVASFIGIGFVLLGAIMISAATWQHLKFSRALPLLERPEHYSMTFSLFIAALVAVCALALALYLAISVSKMPSSETQRRVPAEESTVVTPTAQ